MTLRTRKPFVEVKPTAQPVAKTEVKKEVPLENRKPVTNVAEAVATLGLKKEDVLAVSENLAEKCFVIVTNNAKKFRVLKG
jgi:hypothetical protein